MVTTVIDGSPHEDMMVTERQFNAARSTTTPGYEVVLSSL
jgi:hypothetical protein